MGRWDRPRPPALGWPTAAKAGVTALFLVAMAVPAALIAAGALLEVEREGEMTRDNLEGVFWFGGMLLVSALLAGISLMRSLWGRPASWVRVYTVCWVVLTGVLDVVVFAIFAGRMFGRGTDDLLAGMLASTAIPLFLGVFLALFAMWPVLLVRWLLRRGEEEAGDPWAAEV